MGGPRMGGAGHPRQQKPPEPAPFSGFMSMFSTPNAPNKSPTIGGLFSSSPGSLFGSSPTPRQPQPQQKTSFFGLPSNIGTESITSDLFGIFKGPETSKSEEHQQSGTESEKDDPSGKVTPSENAEKTLTEQTHLSADENIKNSEDSEIPEKGLVEEAEQTDKKEAEENSMTESTVSPEAEAKHDPHAENLDGACSTVPDKGLPAPAPETKGIFEIPSLTAPKFGFMSAAAEGTSSIGSLFSTIPSTATGVKTAQSQQAEGGHGGFFSGFKNLSAGILQDEKPTGKDETSMASSVFGMNLGSIFGNTDPPKAESTPCVITAQPEPESPKPTDELCELESGKPSPGSSETESADASDTEGPTGTSKTGSCDTLAQSPQTGLPSPSSSLAESLEKPQINITPLEIDRSGVDTSDTMHTDLETRQPMDFLTKEAAKRLVQFV